MAITPLDVQAMLAQIDKVAKDVHAQKDGAALHKAMETATRQKIESERLHAVQETDTADSDITGLRDTNDGADGGKDQKNKQATDSENQEHHGAAAKFHDPNLGRYIDLSG